jgi:hypothetical protein
VVISSEELLLRIRATVEAHFPLKELVLQDGHPVFTVGSGPDDKTQFLRLRDALGQFGVLPLLRRRDGETVILLAPKPPPTQPRWRLHIALFGATLATTFAAGYLNALGSCPPGLTTPLVGGAEFSLSLMAILVCHEMGHKLVSIWRGIDSSLPYFIPMPPLPGVLSIGTMGAVILTRAPSPNRDALVELGASGPIAGFLVAVPILAYGIRHSVFLAESSVLALGCPKPVEFPTPQLFDLLTTWLVHPSASAVMNIHPMALAGWVGLLVTGLNLLPAGMLDGGHVMRAVFGPRLHVILSYVGAAACLVFGYWLMGILIFFLIRRGHPGPLDDCSPVTATHKVVAAVLILIFLLSAVPLTIV